MLLIIGPFVAMLYVYIAYIVITKIVKNKSIGNKIMISSLMAVIFYLVPFGDHHFGKMYFNDLCESDGGVKVYKSIELPSKYFDEDNMLKAYKNIRTFNELNVLHRYVGSSELTPKYMKNFKIGLSYKKIIDNKTGVVISEVKNFYFKGGWLVNSIGLEVSPVSCKDSGPDLLIKKTFLSDGK